MEYSPDQSPLTRKAAPKEVGNGQPWGVSFHHAADGLADLYLSSGAISAIFGGPAVFAYNHGWTEQDIDKALSLLQSKLWRVFQAKPHSKDLIVCTDDDISQVAAKLRESGAATWTSAILLEDLVREAIALTFLDKALETLANIQTKWLQNRTDFKLPFSYHPRDDRLLFQYNDSEFPNGLGYGCASEECPQIFDYLLSEKLLRHIAAKVALTGKGLAELERLRRGKADTTPRVFLVRKWNKELDEFLEPVLNTVGKRLNCLIEPVWATHHITQIHERVLRSLRESVVIVVDIDRDNFNVGFEAGYAMALGKPLVAIRLKPDPAVADKRPIDLGTLNCFDYEMTDAGQAELVTVLEARVGLALDSIRKVS